MILLTHHKSTSIIEMVSSSHRMQRLYLAWLWKHSCGPLRLCLTWLWQMVVLIFGCYLIAPDSQVFHIPCNVLTGLKIALVSSSITEQTSWFLLSLWSLFASTNQYHQHHCLLSLLFNHRNHDYNVKNH